MFSPNINNGRYEVVSALGQGGMAVVFKAFDTRLKCSRAIKILSPHYLKNRQVRDRFEAEAATMARLHHRNIVTVHDIGNEQDLIYMVMEMLTGGSLQDRVDQMGPLHPQQAIDAAISMASGLGYAHKHGVVHRDVKLDNVLISKEGILKVADFGIARITDSESSGMTQTGAMMGTVAYMAPEQRLSARKAGPQADLYAVAASFYVMLTGRNPTELYNDDVQEEAFADLPDPIRIFLEKGCAFQKSDRFDDAEHMIEELERLREEISPLPEHAPPVYQEKIKINSPPTEKERSELQTIWKTLIDEHTSDFRQGAPQKITPVVDTEINNETEFDLGIDLMGDASSVDLTGDRASDYSEPDEPAGKEPDAIDFFKESGAPAQTEPDQPEKNKSLLLPIFGALAVLAIGGFLFIQSNNKGPNQNNTNIPDSVETEPAEEVKEIPKDIQKEAVVKTDPSAEKPELQATKEDPKETKNTAPKENTKKETIKKETPKINTTKQTNKTTSPKKNIETTKKKETPVITEKVEPKVPVSTQTSSMMLVTRPPGKVSIKGPTGSISCQEPRSSAPRTQTPCRLEGPLGKYKVTFTNDGQTKTATINLKAKTKNYCWNFNEDGPC